LNPNATQPNPTQTKPNQTKPNHPPPAQIGEQDEREGIPERPVVLFNQRLSRWGAKPGHAGRAGVWPLQLRRAGAAACGGCGPTAAVGAAAFVCGP
jgi:hypothetical protein